MKKTTPGILILFLILLALLPWGIHIQADADALAAHTRSQVLLARQSANTLEALFAAHPSGTAVVADVLLERAAATLPPELVELGLFDLSSRKMLRTPGGNLAAEDLQRLSADILRGGFGSLVLEGTQTAFLATYLPLTLGNTVYSLLLVSPVAGAHSSTAGAFLAAAQSAVALVLALLIGWIWRCGGAADRAREESAEDQNRADSGAQASAAMEQRCEALRLENHSLQATRWEYQILVDGADYGLARLSWSGKIQFCSAPFQRLIGRRSRELKGCNLIDLDLFDQTTRQQVQEAIGRIRNGERPDPFLAELSAQPSGDVTLVSLRLDRLEVNDAAYGLLLTAQSVAHTPLPQVFAS